MVNIQKYHLIKILKQRHILIQQRKQMTRWIYLNFEKEGESVVIKKMKRNPPSVSAGNYSVGDELISDKDGRTYFVGLTKANKTGGI